MTRIHRPEPEDVAKKGPVCLSVFAVNNYVSARNHLPLLILAKWLRLSTSSIVAASCLSLNFLNPKPTRSLRSVQAHSPRSVQASAAHGSERKSMKTDGDFSLEAPILPANYGNFVREQND